MLEFTAIGTDGSQGRLLQLYDPISVDESNLHVNILADPGWNGIDNIDEIYTQSLIDSIDLIILSQATIEYIGAYALLLNKYPQLCDIPTYATLPLCKLSTISILEMYRSIGLLGPIDSNLIEIGKIISIFSQIKTLNYSQLIKLSNINNKQINLSLTAYNSGYSIGGSIWLIEINNEKIIYAPIWNHAKDNFLNNCPLFNNSDFIRPTTLITNSEFINSKLSHQLKIDKLIDLIDKILISGTNVVLPTSISGRFFELIIPLLTNLKNDSFIYIINYTGLDNMKYLSNFLEWMNPNIIKLWENNNNNNNSNNNNNNNNNNNTNNNNPSSTISTLASNRIKVIKLNELNNLIHTGNRPKIFIVDEMNMIDDSVFNQLINTVNATLNYSIILTEPPNKFSKLNDFYNVWKENTQSEIDNEGSLIVLKLSNYESNIFEETPLRSKELSNYENMINERRSLEIRLEKEKLEKKKIEDLLDADVKEISDDDEEDEEENEKEGEPDDNNSNSIIRKNLEITTNIIKEAEAKYQFDESKILKIDKILTLPRDFNVSNLKHKNRVFPTVINKFNFDDYGILIDSKDFQIFDNDKFPIIGDFNENNLNESESSDIEIIDENDNNRKRSRRRNVRDNKRRKNNIENILDNKITTNNLLDSLNNPVSRTYTKNKINITCGFSFIDLSGNHDLRSLKFTIKKIKPKKIIILPEIRNGDSSKLINELKSDNDINNNNEIIKCKLNEMINLGNIITSFDLLLDNKLINKLKWKNLNNEYMITPINGILEKSNKWEYKLKSNENETINTSSQNIKIGDIKLNQLKINLQNDNHNVEFLGDGRLLIDEKVIVAKGNEGKLSIESNLDPLFYKVKSSIENMLANI